MDNDSNDVNLGMGEPLSDTLDMSMSALDNTYTIPISAYTFSSMGATGATGSNYYGNVTINTGSSSSFYTSTGLNGTTWATATQSAGLHVTSDAEFDGDIKWKGRSLGKLLEKIEDRLAILQEPDPAKLEKHAALKKAYDHYKLMERLIGED